MGVEGFLGVISKAEATPEFQTSKSTWDPLVT